MVKYLTKEDYQKVLATYANGDVKNNWKSLFVMVELFERLAREVAGKLKFQYNDEEGKNAAEYLAGLKVAS